MTKIRTIKLPSKPKQKITVYPAEELEQMLAREDAKPTNLVRRMMYDVWSIDEAVTLSFNIDPDFMKAWLQNHGARETALYREYNERRELVSRAVEAGDLKPLKPITFLRWAKGKNIPLPEEIVSLFKNTNKNSSKDVDQGEIAAAVHHRTRDAVYKLYLGIAKLHYGMDLTDLKEAKLTQSKAAEKLNDALDSAGYPVSLSTLNKHLGEALDWLHRTNRIRGTAAGPEFT